MSRQVREPVEIASGTEIVMTVSGMTCGSCAARVERVLSRHDGVASAGVNFATQRATVVFDPKQTSVEGLVDAVGKIGYGLAPEKPAQAGETDPEHGQEQMWLRRVLLAWPLAIAVLVLSLFFMNEAWARWSAFALAIPVQFWAGYPFLHQAALRARARQANMDTVIAIGTGQIHFKQY